MIVYVSKQLDAPDPNGVIIDVSNGIKVTKGDYSWVLNEDAVYAKPEILNIVQNQDGELRMNWFSEAVNNRDGFVYQRTRNMCFELDARYQLSIAICGDGSIHLYSNQMAYVIGADDVIEVGYRKATEVLSDISPEIQRLVAKGRAKQSALGKIGNTDSIAALEMQLDILCRGLNEVFTTHPDAMPLWWPSFRDAVTMSESASARYADIESGIELVRSEKERVREVQRKYFEELAYIDANI